MEYDSEPGVFSPNGRLMQVEYAQHASNQGATMIFQCHEDKIFIAYENRSTNPLLIASKKIYTVDIDRNFCMMFSGFKADSLLVVSEAREIVYNYKHTTSEDISLEALARKIAKYKQTFTVDESMRPFGLRTVLIGIEQRKPRIFVIEPDGNHAEYTKCSLGYRNDVCNEFLEKYENENVVFKALAEVVQMDVSKVAGFVLTDSELIEITQEEIIQMSK